MKITQRHKNIFGLIIVIFLFSAIFGLTYKENFCSVAANNNLYYQPEQGALGESILSGYPYYKAY
jgi:hypothetical protein